MPYGANRFYLHPVGRNKYDSLLDVSVTRSSHEEGLNFVIRSNILQLPEHATPSTHLFVPGWVYYYRSMCFLHYATAILAMENQESWRHQLGYAVGR